MQNRAASAMPYAKFVHLRYSARYCVRNCMLLVVVCAFSISRILAYCHEKNAKSGKIGFAPNRVATAATDICAHGLRAQSRHESNAPYQISYKTKYKIHKNTLLPIVYCLL